MRPDQQQAAVLDVLDSLSVSLDDADGDALRKACDAVAEYIAANEDLLVLYRIKWGNLDSGANKVYDRAIEAHARMKGEAK